MSVDELLMLHKFKTLSERERLEFEVCADNHLRFGRLLAVSDDCLDGFQRKPRAHGHQDFALARRKVFLGKHLVGLIDVTE